MTHARFYFWGRENGLCDKIFRAGARGRGGGAWGAKRKSLERDCIKGPKIASLGLSASNLKTSASK